MKGEYEISGLEEVYRDDIKHIEQLKEGDLLYSICPIYVNPVEQIKTKLFQRSIMAHENARKRGVNVKRVYIFGSQAQHEQIQHELIRQANIFEVYIVNKNDPEFANLFPGGIPDFLLFNTHKASIGRVSEGSVGSTRVTSDKSKIDQHFSKFDKLIQQSVKIDLSNKNGFC